MGHTFDPGNWTYAFISFGTLIMDFGMSTFSHNADTSLMRLSFSVYLRLLLKYGTEDRYGLGGPKHLHSTLDHDQCVHQSTQSCAANKSLSQASWFSSYTSSYSGHRHAAHGSTTFSRPVPQRQPGTAP